MIFLAGVTYGVYFAFPYPDFPAESAEEANFDSMVSSVSMLVDLGLIFPGVVGVLRKHLSNK